VSEGNAADDTMMADQVDFPYCFMKLKWYIRVLLNHGCFINFVLYLPETKYAGDDSVYIGVGRHSCLKADLIIR